MGGAGSGQRPSRYSTRDCRVVSVGELLAAARRHPPGGEVLWRARDDGKILGRLSYGVSEEHWPEGTDLRVLALRYQATPQAAESRERLILDPGQPALAHCPACERPLRKLYAPPGATHFLCRCCHGLVYRSPPRNDGLAELQAAMGDLLHGLYVDEELLAKHGNYKPPDLAALIATVEQERPLDDQELRIWCLRLSKAGLSLRAIARHCGVSKSSVARYLAGGLGGIDQLALGRERLRRYYDGQLTSLAGLPLRAQARLLTRHVRKLGLERHSAQEREEKLVL